MRRILSGLAAVAWVSGVLFAMTPEQILSKMEDQEKSLETIRFDFKQTVDFFGTEKPTRVEGTATFGQKGRMNIHRTKPEEQTTVSDGKKIWVYNPTFQQVWVGAVKTWNDPNLLPKGMIPLHNLVAQLRDQFRVGKGPAVENEGAVSLNAWPKNDEMAYRLELVVSTTTWLPLRTVYISETARVVTSMSDVRINPPGTDALFTFQTPKGADVIQLN